jgi:BlaI family transcriptional regulator, penicillinase repressor
MDDCMAASRPKVTDAQLAVLEALWEGGPQTIRQLTATLYPQQTLSDYATVQKLLEQLEVKGCAKRDRSEMAHVFQAGIARNDLVDAQLKETADKLCGGSLTSVLVRLVEAGNLSKSERDRLRTLLEEAKQRRRR